MDEFLNDWNGSSNESSGMEIIDAFFQGEGWKGVCKWAEKDCDDSLELMQEILLRINSLVFFKELEDDNRTSREIIELSELIKPYLEI
jgi:hypothetical protein